MVSSYMYGNLCFDTLDLGWACIPLVLWALGCCICLSEHWSGPLGLQGAWCYQCPGNWWLYSRPVRCRIAATSVTLLFYHLSIDMLVWNYKSFRRDPRLTRFINVCFIIEEKKWKKKCLCVCEYIPSCACLTRYVKKILFLLA